MVTWTALIDLRPALTFWSTISTTTVSALAAFFTAGHVSLGVHAWGLMRDRRRAA
jgi:hypothetical protein